MFNQFLLPNLTSAFGEMFRDLTLQIFELLNSDMKSKVLQLSNHSRRKIESKEEAADVQMLFDHQDIDVGCRTQWDFIGYDNKFSVSKEGDYYEGLLAFLESDDGDVLNIVDLLDSVGDDVSMELMFYEVEDADEEHYEVVFLTQSVSKFEGQFHYRVTKYHHGSSLLNAIERGYFPDMPQRHHDAVIALETGRIGANTQRFTQKV